MALFPETTVITRTALAVASWMRAGVASWELLAVASKVTRSCELHRTELPVSHSCVFFARFCFELVFGVNMKVVENFVSFPMALV
jgi:hypothetical protein